MIRYSSLLLIAGVFAAAPLHAQSHPHGQSGHQHGGHGQGAHAQAAPSGAQAEHGEHGGMCDHQDALHRHAPKQLLEHREMLQLTAAQVESLEALQAAHHDRCRERMEQIRAAEAAATAALEQETPDLAVFEARLREAASRKIDCRVDMARTGQAAQALLNAEQKAHLAHMKHAGH